MPDIKLRSKLWLEVDGKPVIGEGKASLLLEIYNTGSLSEAARRLGISYRHAHDMVGEMNDILGFRVLETEVGGRGGGGTRLTPEGLRMVEEFIRAREKLDRWLEEHSPTFK